LAPPPPTYHSPVKEYPVPLLNNDTGRHLLSSIKLISVHFLSTFKGTVSVISSEPLCKDANA